ncbi:protein-disulfide reductase DsbD domain-containing protein [Roseivivax sp. CAU 1761]
MIRRILLTALTALALPLAAPAQTASDPVAGTVRPGWREADGTHVAALQLTLAPGWKTYWRAPGEAGIPPSFDWRGSRNLRAVSVVWPVPEVFELSGLRSVGYSDQVVLPLRIAPASGGPVELVGRIDIGVCKDVCLPRSLEVRATLPASPGPRDPSIAAALATRPLSAAEAGVGAVRCRIAPAADGIDLTAEIEMPALGRDEAAVIETADPEIWVDEPELRRDGPRLTARARLSHVAGQSFALDRSGVRITVLAGGQAADIQGCSG